MNRRVYGALARASLASALVACQASPTSLATPSTAPNATPTAAASPTPQPPVAESVPPNPLAPTPVPSPSLPTPEASAPTSGDHTDIISGTVYDEQGAPVDGATITVLSLDASVPYKATAATSQGQWVVNSVPEGANVEITASRPGWTSRHRLGTFQTQADTYNLVNFGGTGAKPPADAPAGRAVSNGQTTTPATTLDHSGDAYFISDRPEVAAVSPALAAQGVDPTNVSYQLTLSEPLDAANQAKFGDSVRLLPANAEAAPNNDGTGDYSLDLSLDTTQLDRPADLDPTQGAAGYSRVALPNHPLAGSAPTAGANVPWDYAIANGTTFLGDPGTQATVTFDSKGAIATLTFHAPLITNRSQPARYQVALVAPPSGQITDPTGNALGFNAKGAFLPLTPGTLLHGCFLAPSLAAFNPVAASRWSSTHTDAASFGVSVDTQPPTAKSVLYTAAVGGSSRFELTFDKPLVAYNGRPGGQVDAAIRDGSLLRTLSFAASNTTTSTLALAGGTPSYALNPLAITDAATFGAPGDLDREFWLGGGTTTPASATWTDPSQNALLPYGTDPTSVDGIAADFGKLLFAISANSPNTLYLYVIGRHNLFGAQVVALKARVEALADPAGNPITASQADRNQLIGPVNQ